MDWQEIGSAPNDKDVLIFCPQGVCTRVFVAFRDNEGDWVTPDIKLVEPNSGMPSHWMPLPTEPTS